MPFFPFSRPGKEKQGVTPSRLKFRTLDFFDIGIRQEINEKIPLYKSWSVCSWVCEFDKIRANYDRNHQSPITVICPNGYRYSMKH